MGQAKSYNESYLEKQMGKIESEIIQLKAIQNYDPSQINYSYKSNSVSIDAYQIAPSVPDYGHYGILASLIFTSRFPNIFPRVSFDYTGYGQASGYIGDGALLTQRTEYWSKNQTRIIIYLLDTLIPMDTPYQFNIQAFVYSNVAGTLALEKTYVIPGL